MAYSCIHIEGGLIPAELIDEISTGDAPGQQPGDFGLPPGVRLTDEIAAAWADARIYWEAFQRGLRRAAEDDPATSITREQWILPLLRALGYHDLTFTPRAEIIGRSTYAISHRAGTDETAPPLHTTGCRVELDKRPPGGTPRLSAHALLQEYLNRTEHLWGIAGNGYQLRLLRDSALMTRPAFVEFDLRQMLEGEHFADFTLLYRLAPRSRLPLAMDSAAECWLERYFQQAIEQGGRVRDRLRDGVEVALERFGSGFLRHPASQPLRDRLQSGQLSARDYYRQLLRLVYRLLFLMVSEERGLVGPTDPTRSQIYRRYYSVARLREQAEGHLAADERHADVWLGLGQTFQLYEDQAIADRLGMHALDGDLFGPKAIADLDSAHIYNVDFLRALRRLSLYRDDKAGITRRVNYGALDVEELGSVYESLLEYHPVVEPRHGRLVFAFVLGSERKTTGSYYTRPELVQELIKSALEPVIEARLKDAGAQRAAEQALLSIKVIDPAAGSGHFLLAAARRLGRELARLRTGEAYPTPSACRQARREVISHCIYGVDKNPLAVDLCKVALWLEGHNQGKPLTFLDHRIRHGDSLVGVFDLRVLVEGLPDEAFKPVTGDDSKLAADLRKRNKQEREGQLGLFSQMAPPDLSDLAARWRQLSDIPDSDIAAIRRKQAGFSRVRAQGSDWETIYTACNLWTAAFLLPIGKDKNKKIAPHPTTAEVRNYLASPRAANAQLVGRANGLAAQADFFHWPLDFPDVFARSSVRNSDYQSEPQPRNSDYQSGPQPRNSDYQSALQSELQTGFDVVLGNPPWERIKLQEQEFFAARQPEIAAAPNKAARQKLIDRLPATAPALAAEFEQAKHLAEATSRFVRASERYPLTAKGDVNTYALFAEHNRRLLTAAGRAGMIVPTGIATDNTTKDFFGDVIQRQSLARLTGFENEAFIFPAVHHSFKFCALTLTGPAEKTEQADFAFFCRHFADVQQPERHFQLSARDLGLINPNTFTCPIFRTRTDAELTKKIYRAVPVLHNEQTGANPWGIRFSTMFHMSNDSGLFRTRPQLEAEGWQLDGNHFIRDNQRYLPLYEAKMIWQFDHRYGSYAGRDDGRGFVVLPEPTIEYYQNPDYLPLPYYWVEQQEVERLLQGWSRQWLIGFRDIASAVVIRTSIFSLLPRVGVGNKIPLWLLEFDSPALSACLLANTSVLVFDYVVRQKVGGITLNFFIVKQFPVLPPERYRPADLQFIVPRVLELVYTAWDLKPFADDVWNEAGEPLQQTLRHQWQENRAATGGHPAEIENPQSKIGIHLPPFKWDEARRAVLRAELDAWYARLYGLSLEELRYILDPADVHGPDFPGETFRVLKEKETKQHGEYRTRRLVLEAWDRLGGCRTD
jgi:hypothetical protein